MTILLSGIRAGIIVKTILSTTWPGGRVFCLGEKMQEKEKIEYWPLAEIKPYPKNPRINDDAVAYVANSIKEFGFRSPIVVDKAGVIIAGHTRLKAAKKLGLKEAPVIVADDLSDEQVKALRLADNKTAEAAEWDLNLLDQEISEIADIDMSDFGFELDEEPSDAAEAVDDDFEEPEDIEPIAKRGQIYRLGEQTLMCGDSTNENDVKKLIGGEQVDLLITDPPYNVAYEGKTSDRLRIENDSMDSNSFYDFLHAAFTNAANNMMPGAAFYIWYAPSSVVEFCRAAEDAGLLIKEELIWNKNTMVLGRQDYQWKHEPCLYGWKEGASHHWYSDRKQTTVLDFDKPAASRLHPTMKPIPLFDYQIKNSSKPGDRVLDLFGGSGTTLMACQQNGRKSYTMEYDPHYVDIIIKRWEDFTGEKAELINE
jgi:DNA modification methylase